MTLTRKLEDQLIEAMRTSNIEALDNLIADNLLFINHEGTRVTKAQDIEMHAAGTIKIETIEHEALHITEYENCSIADAVITIRGKYAGQELSARFHHLRTWAKLNSRWQVIGLKTTVI